MNKNNELFFQKKYFIFENIKKIEIKMNCFYYDNAVSINVARIEHLRTLGLPFAGKTVFETGCGGKGDITKFLLDSGAKVTLNDARHENIESLMQNINTELPFNLWDLNNPIQSNEQFDAIVSYGTLYHLHQPAQAIQTFSDLTKDFVVLCTIVNGKSGINLDIVHEDRNIKNQCFNDHGGCRPSREWVFVELSKHFPYVYYATSQPNHNEFPKDWNHLSSTVASRAVFLASRTPVENAHWTTTLPMVQN